eukprot:44626-Pelagomonas_calceolata.AAC.4
MPQYMGVGVPEGSSVVWQGSLLCARALSGRHKCTLFLFIKGMFSLHTKFSFPIEGNLDVLQGKERACQHLRVKGALRLHKICVEI